MAKTARGWGVEETKEGVSAKSQAGSVETRWRRTTHVSRKITKKKRNRRKIGAAVRVDGWTRGKAGQENEGESTVYAAKGYIKGI